MADVAPSLMSVSGAAVVTFCSVLLPLDPFLLDDPPATTVAAVPL